LSKKKVNISERKEYLDIDKNIQEKRNELNHKVSFKTCLCSLIKSESVFSIQIFESKKKKKKRKKIKR
jgi:hypothetical protein